MDYLNWLTNGFETNTFHLLLTENIYH